MEKIINKDGKFYQEVEVIMLATENNNSTVGDIILNLHDKTELSIITNTKGVFRFGDTGITIGKSYSDYGLQHQHLHFTSNEEIKEGDWYMSHALGIKPMKHTERGELFLKGKKFNVNKIIATTDSSLTIQLTDNILQEKGDYIKCLPRPETDFIESFIKSYNEGKVITKALIEVDFIRDSDTGNPNFGGYDIPDKYELKITEDNTIIS